MNYQIEMPRQSFDGLCMFLQQWAEIYAQPGAVVFKGSLRKRQKGPAGAVVRESAGIGDAKAISKRYDMACHALGRSRVRKNDAMLDLRDLVEEEMEALVFVADMAKLKPQQTRVMLRIKQELQEFLKLPAMVRLALAAKD